MNISPTQPSLTPPAAIIDENGTLHGNLPQGLSAIESNTCTGYFFSDRSNSPNSYQLDQLIAALRKNQSVKEIFLRNIGLSSQQFIQLIEASKNLENLDLANAVIHGEFNTTDIAKALNTSSIKSLYLGFTQFDGKVLDETKLAEIFDQLREERKKQISVNLWSKKITHMSVATSQ